MVQTASSVTKRTFFLTVYIIENDQSPKGLFHCMHFEKNLSPKGLLLFFFTVFIIEKDLSPKGRFHCIHYWKETVTKRTFFFTVFIIEKDLSDTKRTFSLYSLIKKDLSPRWLLFTVFSSENIYHQKDFLINCIPYWKRSVTNMIYFTVFNIAKICCHQNDFSPL